MDGDWRKLGIEITRRRSEMGYRSRPAFARFSGLSLRILDYLEAGARETYRPSTLDRIEYALGWRPGTVERVLGGHNPTLDADRHMAVLRELWPDLSEPLKDTLVRLARAETGR